MKVHTLEPISIGGNRIEPGCVCDLEPHEYVRLARANAVEPVEVYEAKRAARAAVAKAHAETAELTAELEAAAKAEAARMSDEAMAKADGERKTDARKRAESAKPVEDVAPAAPPKGKGRRGKKNEAEAETAADDEE